MLGSVGGNILGSLYFGYFQAAGSLVTCCLFKKEKSFVKLLLGSVLGSVLLQWMPVLFAFVFDFTLISHILAIAVLLPVLILCIRRLSQCDISLSGLWGQIRCHGLFFLLFTGLMVLWLYLLCTHTIPLDETGAMGTGQCTYGDMNMHLGFISSLAVQGSFPPEYSLFPGEKLAYPFLSDSISSSIYLMGASLRYAYILPMITAFVQVVGGVYLLAHTLFHSRTKALLTYILFFFNGGLGFVYFMDWTKTREFTLHNIFTDFYTTPTNLVNYNIRWVNIIADMLLPQRATLFGYATLFSAIWLLYKAVFDGEKEYFLPAGILVGSLPMIHTHSFLAAAFLSASWLLLYLYGEAGFRLFNGTSGQSANIRGAGQSIVMSGPFKNISLTFRAISKHSMSLLLLAWSVIMCLIQKGVTSGHIQDRHLLAMGLSGIGICVLYGIAFLILILTRKGWKALAGSWGIYLVAVFLLALPQLFFWTFGHATGDGFVRGYFNWGNQGDFYLWFYLKNLGLPLILIVAAICDKNRKRTRLVFPAIIIWFAAELIVFQPNVYDNNKLLYVAYLLLCLAAVDYGVDLYRRIKDIAGVKWFAGLFLSFSILSAILTLGREVVSNYQLYGPAEVQMALYIEEHAKPDDTFLTTNNHNNVVSSLTGRNIVCGSDSFLFFHGYDTATRKSDIRKMYESPAKSLDLFAKYKVSYIVISSYERANYAIDEAKIKEISDLVFIEGNVQLYRVK